MADGGDTEGDVDDPLNKGCRLISVTDLPSITPAGTVAAHIYCMSVPVEFTMSRLIRSVVYNAV